MVNSGSGPTSPRGRRPGDEGTAAVILEAARDVFAERSYEGASVREVARRARVDPALVLHYFGSKQELFGAAMRPPIDPEAVAAVLLAGPHESIGEAFVLALLTHWGNPRTRGAFLGVLRAAVSNPEAAEMLRDFVTTRLLYPVAQGLGADHPRTRAGLAGTQLIGLAFLRYVVPLDSLSSLQPEQLAVMVGPAIQRYLTGPLDIDPGGESA